MRPNIWKTLGLPISPLGKLALDGYRLSSLPLLCSLALVFPVTWTVTIAWKLVSPS